MQMHKLCVVFFAALLALTPSAGQAAGIVLKNSMNTDIKSVFCVGNNGERLSVVEGLPKRGTKTVAAAKFPEHSCSRIGVTMQRCRGGSIITSQNRARPRKIEFTLDSAGQHETRKYPSVLITLPDNDAYVAPAGVPMFLLVQTCARAWIRHAGRNLPFPATRRLKIPARLLYALLISRGALQVAASNFPARAEPLKHLPCLRLLPTGALGAGFDDLKEWLAASGA